MKKLTKSQFAANIRSQYPGSYDDLSDDKLVELWLRKFPHDRHKIISDDNNESLGSLKWGLVLVLLVVMYFTNPTANSHRKAVSKTVKPILEAKVEKYELLKSMMDNDYVKNLIDIGINSMVRRSNYFVVSFTQLKIGEEYQIIGIGIFGQVYLFDAFEEELENILNNLDKANPFST